MSRAASVVEPADGVGPVGVAAVDDEVARFEERDELVDHRIDRRPGLHHDHDRAWRRQRTDERLDRGGRGELALAAVVGDERVGLRRRAVVHGDREAVGRDVAGEVLAHHRESGEPEVQPAAGLDRRACSSRAFVVMRPFYPSNRLPR